jgi:hypothetical protein
VGKEARPAPSRVPRWSRSAPPRRRCPGRRSRGRRWTSRLCTTCCNRAWTQSWVQVGRCCPSLGDQRAAAAGSGWSRLSLSCLSASACSSTQSRSSVTPRSPGPSCNGSARTSAPRAGPGTGQRRDWPRSLVPAPSWDPPGRLSVQWSERCCPDRRRVGSREVLVLVDCRGGVLASWGRTRLDVSLAW